MPGPPANPHRSPSERLWAWLYTGPLGHFYSVVADLSVFAAGSAWARVRRRVAGTLSR